MRWSIGLEKTENQIDFAFGLAKTKSDWDLDLVLVWQKPKSIRFFFFCLKRHMQFNLVLVWQTKPIFFCEDTTKTKSQLILIWTNNKEGAVRRV